ncbi:membrane protein [Mycolicibacterium doricum]|uniref:Membrane protein n=1 Tax=Mycolicibacterium doricum TaxID=126673 RepID=A0A1X1TDN0_9MYCO|nr:HPP family protein [Mycolicibacterium doricum]MCV7266869.1 HPP family protein [Mycolicibacterium doricum]ORV42625.1 hypothetical protein AWC01_07835 [Mycolicibacterium doricum]BBZ06993.1 membrane protein [Mycolicibacterium doricum]
MSASNTASAASSPDGVAPASKRKPWWVSAAPPRPPVKTIAIALFAAAVGLLVLAALTVGTGIPWLIPPMAASMALVVGAPKLPLSQPRNVIGGQMVSAAVGAVVGLMGHSLWLGALAGALALAAMLLCRVPHSPAAATAVIGTMSATVPGWEFVLLAGAAALVLVLAGVLGNRFNGARDYPIYVW